VDGVPFEYTTGTPIRAESFIGRRLVASRGVLVAVARLAALRCNGHRVAVLAYLGTSRCSLRYVALTAAARVMRIPVVLELCEVPWTLEAGRRPWERVFSPLALTSGVITISGFLTSWANTEYASRKRDATATEIPILVDVDEVRPSPQLHSQEAVVYAASSGYDDSLAFVLEAMRHVWKSEPHWRLVVTGIAPDELDSNLCRRAFTSGETAMVIGVGRVSREALLRLYADASACLAPVFDDQRSRARFPTKIAEYAAAGRPIVTSSVGEVRRYLVDRTTAFIAEPDDPVAFGRKIVEALSDPEFADAVGTRARGLAEEVFDYRVHAPRLREALTRTLAPYLRAVR
jgi:glycosyltransferase involved in cell wall biosynthesis